MKLSSLLAKHGAKVKDQNRQNFLLLVVKEEALIMQDCLRQKPKQKLKAFNLLFYSSMGLMLVAEPLRQLACPRPGLMLVAEPLRLLVCPRLGLMLGIEPVHRLAYSSSRQRLRTKF